MSGTGLPAGTEGGITIPTAISSADAASSALAAALGSVGAIAAPTATSGTGSGVYPSVGDSGFGNATASAEDVAAELKPLLSGVASSSGQDNTGLGAVSLPSMPGLTGLPSTLGLAGSTLALPPMNFSSLNLPSGSMGMPTTSSLTSSLTASLTSSLTASLGVQNLNSADHHSSLLPVGSSVADAASAVADATLNHTDPSAAAGGGGNRRGRGGGSSSSGMGFGNDNDGDEDGRDGNDGSMGVEGALPSPQRLGASPLWQCGLCEKRFTKRSNAKRHLDTVHDRSRFWRCKVCRSTFTQRGSLTRHLQRAHSMTRGSKGLATFVDPPSGVSLDGETEADDERMAVRKANAAARKKAAADGTPMPIGSSSSSSGSTSGRGRGRGRRGGRGGRGGAATTVVNSNVPLPMGSLNTLPSINFNMVPGGAGSGLPFFGNGGSGTGSLLGPGSAVDVSQLSALLNGGPLPSVSGSGSSLSGGLGGISSSLLLPMGSLPQTHGGTSSSSINTAAGSAGGADAAAAGGWPALAASLSLSLPLASSSLPMPPLSMNSILNTIGSEPSSVIDLATLTSSFANVPPATSTSSSSSQAISASSLTGPLSLSGLDMTASGLTTAIPASSSSSSTADDDGIPSVAALTAALGQTSNP